jgi:hypothetical protein
MSFNYDIENIFKDSNRITTSKDKKFIPPTFASRKGITTPTYNNLAIKNMDKDLVTEILFAPSNRNINDNIRPYVLQNATRKEKYGEHSYNEQFYIIEDYVYYMSENSWNELWFKLLKQPFIDNALDFTIQQINRDNTINTGLDLKQVAHTITMNIPMFFSLPVKGALIRYGQTNEIISLDEILTEKIIKKAIESIIFQYVIKLKPTSKKELTFTEESSESTSLINCRFLYREMALFNIDETFDKD